MLKKILAAGVAGLALVQAAVRADVKLPAIIGDNMVLQQETAGDFFEIKTLDLKIVNIHHDET